MMYNPTKKDYSTPYKTFNDLKNDDVVYIIDYKTVSIINVRISSYSKKLSDDRWKQNCWEIQFTLPELENKKCFISDGNTFIFNAVPNEDVYITTDCRIAETIFNLLRSRNMYQWHMFSSIFGNTVNLKHNNI